MSVKNKQLLALCLTVLVNLTLKCNAQSQWEDENIRLVTLKEGKIKGAVTYGFDGFYFAFNGIPYAHVPARFSAPVPPLPWEGIRDAKKHGSKCPQYNMLVEQYFPGDENCLFLNVYTKSMNPRSKVPVMVFIHGGPYMFGDGDTDGAGDSDKSLRPGFLLLHDAVIVTMNYRLEVLGFLTLDTPEVPGNAGLKDQVAALKWVKNNIAKFGGDPDNVTIFGESSGSSAVTQHLQSPMSKGLFHKAIAQSGVSIADWATAKDGKERALRAAKFLGHNTTDTTKVLEFLRSVPVEKLTNLTFETMTEEEDYRDLPIHFAPVVEKKFKNVEAFMTEEPISSLTAGKINKIPLMIGYNSDESLIMLDDAFGKLNFTNNNLKYLVPREIAQRVTEEKTQELGGRIRNHYVGNRAFTKDDAKAISDMLSDRHFVYNIHRFVNFYSRLCTTFLYKFSFDTELNVVKKYIGYGHNNTKAVAHADEFFYLFSNKFQKPLYLDNPNVVKNNISYGHMNGAAHADELYYIFSNKFNKALYLGNPHLKDIVYRVTGLWVDFARTGNPSNPAEMFFWPPYTRTNRAFMEINEKFTAGQDTEKARVEFWDKIYCDAGLPCISKENS